MVTAALTMIAHSFIEASYYIQNTMNHNSKIYNRKALADAYAFVQGTGLEISLQRFSLDYDADILRRNFNYLFHETI